MSIKTFGSAKAIPTRNFCRLSPETQREGILLLRELGFTKREILQHTRLFCEEYNALFDGSLKPYRLEEFER